MIHFKKVIFSCMLITGFLVKIAVADCYFIRLNGYSLSLRADVFSWGELSPMIGLEEGQFYHLLPDIETSEKKATNLHGELYYIPQSLINEQNQFSLRMIVLERDEKTSDDLVLPLRQRDISLESKEFRNDIRHVKLTFKPFAEEYNSLNAQSYQFDILKRSEECSLSTALGKENDLQYRLENRLKHLSYHIGTYKNDFLDGAREYRYYRTPEIENKNVETGLNKAVEIAELNAHELIILGKTLEKQKKSKKFPIVWNAYKELVKHLLDDNITIQYEKEKKWETMFVPALAFHPKWKDFNRSSEIILPEDWKIILPQ